MYCPGDYGIDYLWLLLQLPAHLLNEDLPPSLTKLTGWGMNCAWTHLVKSNRVIPSGIVESIERI